MRFQLLDSLQKISASQWNSLLDENDLFLRHEYLLGLETTQCACPANGWQPRHALLIDDDEQLLAAAPGYLKSHSYGEFVFDFAWADAHARYGFPYYPKWVFAVPFTPVVGPRVLGKSETYKAELIRQVQTQAESDGIPAINWLFPQLEDQQQLIGQSYLARRDCQYLWHNPGHESFDAFLITLKASERKKIRRERRKVKEAGISVIPTVAEDIPAEEWPTLFRFYEHTYHLRGQEPYWNIDFMLHLAAAFPKEMLLFVARRDTTQEAVGVAIAFRSTDTLYGRHWGSLETLDSLHFETCYYRCIEYCIEHQLCLFDAGAQGEHKLRRGFKASATHSAHWIAHPGMRQAIANFLGHETTAIEDYIDNCHDQQNHKPTKQSNSAKALP